MIFLGTTFCAHKHSLDFTSTHINDIKSILLKNGIFGELYVTNNVVYSYTLNIPQTWDYNTKLHALFNGNLLGGNVDFTAEQVSIVRVKRREKGTFKWITLFEVPIQSREDFSFIRNDKYARSETEYEYAIVPVMNLVEGNLNIGSVKSEFDGVFILDKDTTFSTVLDNMKYSTQRNKESNVVNTMNSRYPFVISNGINDYETINLTATFIKYNPSTLEWEKHKEGFDYRRSLDDFLHNGNTKILKMPHTGEIWMVNVAGGQISKSSNGHYEYVTTNINFVEVGSCLSTNNLYDNGFIDVNVEGS